MAWGVSLVVTFRCDGPRGVSELAHRHLAALEEAEAEYARQERPARWSPEREHRSRRAAIRFLSALADGRGIDADSKGGRFAWSTIENWADPEHFVEALAPFWQEMLGQVTPPPRPDWEGPHTSQSLVVLYEEPEVRHATAVVIESADDRRAPATLRVTRHGLPFSIVSSSPDYWF